MKEIWKPIKDYEGLYEISNMGNVKSLNYSGTKECKLMKASPIKSGYLRLTLSLSGTIKSYYIHRLVADHFIKNFDNDKIEVNHKDGNKSNNRSDNLEWCTHKQNQVHAYKNKLLKIPSFKYGFHDEETRIKCGSQHNKKININNKCFESIKTASEKLNIHRTTIGSRLRSNKWKNYEYIKIN